MFFSGSPLYPYLISQWKTGSNFPPRLFFVHSHPPYYCKAFSQQLCIEYVCQCINESHLLNATSLLINFTAVSDKPLISGILFTASVYQNIHPVTSHLNPLRIVLIVFTLLRMIVFLLATHVSMIVML